MLIDYTSQTLLLIIQENPVAMQIYESEFWGCLPTSELYKQTGVSRFKNVKNKGFFIFIKRTDVIV